MVTSTFPFLPKCFLSFILLSTKIQSFEADSKCRLQILSLLAILELCAEIRILETAAVASWLERPPRERVVGSIPGRDRPKSLKVVVVAFPFGAQDYGNSITTEPPVSGYWTG